MLSLTDPKWGELQSTYGDGTRVAELLSLAQGDVPLDCWYDKIVQELCHQYTVSEAAYAAMPHLVSLAQGSQEQRKHLLVLAGMCFACAQLPGIQPVPTEWEQEWHAAARRARPLLAEILSTEELSDSDLRYLLSSLAAFNGHAALALAIEALDSEIACPDCGNVFDWSNQVN